MKHSIFLKSVVLGYEQIVITKKLSVLPDNYRAPPHALRHHDTVAYDVDYPGLILRHAIRINAHLQRILAPIPIRALSHLLII